MESKVTWKNRLSFTGSSASGFTVPLGTEPAVGGDNDGFRPMELIAIGLAGCTAMDTISILLKKRQDVTAFDVIAHAERAEDYPKVFTHITLEYQIEGRQIDPAAVERAIELSATKYCPAQAMLEKSVKIEHKFTIKESGG
jgi:putative redox protein